MEYDLNEIASKLNALEAGRQEELKHIEELRANLKSIDNNVDLFESIERNKTITAQNDAILKEIDKSQKRYNEIFDAQIEFSNIERNYFSEITNINEQIVGLKNDVVKVENWIKKAQEIPGSEKLQEESSNLKEEKLLKIKELEAKKELYFNKKKNTLPEEKESEKSLDEQSKKLDEEKKQLDDQLKDLLNKFPGSSEDQKDNNKDKSNEQESNSSLKPLPEIVDDFTKKRTLDTKDDEESISKDLDNHDSEEKENEESAKLGQDMVKNEENKKVLNTKPASEHQKKNIWANIKNKLPKLGKATAVVAGIAAMVTGGIALATILGSTSVPYLALLAGGYVATKSGVKIL